MSDKNTTYKLGIYKGIQYRLANAGSPNYGAGRTAYVKLPEKHPWTDLDYDEIPCDVHGGLTFQSYIHENESTEVWVSGKWPVGEWIGWDYNHYGDTADKYTWSRIEDDVKSVIDQLRAARNAQLEELAEIEELNTVMIDLGGVARIYQYKGALKPEEIEDALTSFMESPLSDGATEEDIVQTVLGSFDVAFTELNVYKIIL